MLRSVILVFLLLCAASYAQSANTRAETEAISYLRPCHQPTLERQSLCQQNQLNFVEEYVLAKSGDTGGMGSTAASFTPPYNDQQQQDDIGLPKDRVQACAWRMVIAGIQRTTAANGFAADGMVRSACAPLSSISFATAEHRADHLRQDLQTSRAAAPGDDWCAHIPWIKVDCSADHSKLDSTVTPLKAD